MNIPNEQMGYITNSEVFYGVKMDATANLSGQQEIKDLFNVMERSGKWRLLSAILRIWKVSLARC